MLGEFFDWWGGQLLDLAPPAWRGGGQGADALVADAGQPGLLTLLRRRRGVESRLGQIRLDDPQGSALRAALNGRPRGEKVLLRLPAEAVLERSVVLPLAAERDPERVLGYEMERLTPFTAEEVFWGYGIEERDKTRSRLVVRLTVVPRAAIVGLIEVLTRQGGRPDLLEAPSPGGVRSIRLTHEGANSVRAWLSARSLMVTAGGLALLVLVSPFLRQSLALSDLQERLETMRPRVVQAEQLRRKISGAGTGGDAVAAETRRLGDTLEALAAVTEILPDDSYLTEFTMRERKMTLSGLSASAPKLINALSTDPRIKNPSFTAPVTRSESNHNDVFSIRAELAN